MQGIGRVEKQQNYYVVATVSVLLVTGVALSVLAGMSRWNWSAMRQNVSKFFSKDLALRATLVGLGGTLTLTLPYGVAGVKSYQRDHLKMEHRPENSDQELNALIEHNSKFWKRPGKLQCTQAGVKAVIQMAGRDPDAKLISVINRYSQLPLEATIPIHPDAKEGNDLIAKYSPSVLAKQDRPTVCAICSHALASSATVFGNVIEAIGLGDLFKASKSPIEASFKGQKILMLVSIINIIIPILVPSVGAHKAGVIVGCSVGGLIVVSVAWPSFKPLPNQLPGNGINVSQMPNTTSIDPDDSLRNAECERIAEVLLRGKHVMLVGPSRVGKTKTAHKFFQQLKLGYYPNLPDLKPYYWNTANIATLKPSSFMGGEQAPLAQIVEQAGQNNAGSMLFCFDEVHTAKTNPTLLDQMKTEFEPGRSPIKYVVCITTQEEFDATIRDTPLANRFEVIEISSMDAEETACVLRTEADRHPSMPIIDDDTLAKIIEKSTIGDQLKETPQPFTATSVLKRFIQKLNRNPLPSINKKIDKINRSIQLAVSKAKSSASRSPAEELCSQIKSLETDKAKLEKARTEIKDKIRYVQRCKTLLKEVRSELYQTRSKKKTDAFYTVLALAEQELLAVIQDQQSSLWPKSTTDEDTADEDTADLAVIQDQQSSLWPKSTTDEDTADEDTTSPIEIMLTEALQEEEDARARRRAVIPDRPVT